MGLLNTHGEALARLVQQGLVRAGMKDVTVLSVQPSGGRRLVLRHGSALHRVQVLPVGRNPKTPDDEPGWLPLLVSSGFDDATLHRLADAGASFLDDQGNAHLSLDGRTVLFAQTDKPVRRDTHAKVTGLQPQAKRAPGALALNRASHRVAFALLANPDLAASPVRALAAASRASIGTVHNTACPAHRCRAPPGRPTSPPRPAARHVGRVLSKASRASARASSPVRGR